MRFLELSVIYDELYNVEKYLGPWVKSFRGLAEGEFSFCHLLIRSKEKFRHANDVIDIEGKYLLSFVAW